MGPHTVQDIQSRTGVGPKICLQSLLKMLGYEHVGAVQLQTFITTSQVLKTDYKVSFTILYKITFPISVVMPF